MGTNYYLKYKNKEIHLGKSSAGWKFLFQINGELNSWKKIKEFIKTKRPKIFDEYGRKIKLKDLEGKIQTKQNEKSHKEVLENDPVLPTKVYIDSEGYEFIKEIFD